MAGEETTHSIIYIYISSTSVFFPKLIRNVEKKISSFKLNFYVGSKVKIPCMVHTLLFSVVFHGTVRIAKIGQPITLW